MKKRSAAVICFVLLAACCLSLVACNPSKDPELRNPIDFGKKYFCLLYDNSGFNTTYYYTFESDHTGCYCSTLFGSIDFVWEEASDGAVYLIPVETHYNPDYAGDEPIRLTPFPLYFTDEFFVIRTFSSNIPRYVKEGSDLAKLIEKKPTD